MTKPLSGRRAVVTGASRGLGAAIAWALAAKGADLVITARTTDRLESLAKAIRKTFAVAVDVRPADLSSAKELEDLALSLEERGIDILVNNAGVAQAGYFDAISPDSIRSMLHVNLVAPLFLSQAVLPKMLRSGWGRLVFVGSAGGGIALPTLTAYGATKAGIKPLAEGLRRELLTNANVRVTVAVPGVVRGEASERMIGKIDAYFIRSPFAGVKPIERLPFARRLAEAIVKGRPRVEMLGGRLRFLAYLNHICPEWVGARLRAMLAPRRDRP